MSVTILPTANIVNSVLQPVASCIYHRHNSIFDLVLKHLDINVFDIEYVTDFYYNVLISNNPIDHSQKTLGLAKQLHINDVVIFHDAPPPQFKKEDIIIMKNALVKSHKIFTTDQLKFAWGYSDEDKVFVVGYGIPKIHTEHHIKTKKSVLVLNFIKNPQISTVYQNIKGFLPDTEMITIMPKDIQSAAEIFSEYKVCVDFQHPINSLFGISIGCHSIGTYDITNMSAFDRIQNMQTINSVIINRLAQIDSGSESERIDITESFSFKKFSNELYSVITKASKEVFTI